MSGSGDAIKVTDKALREIMTALDKEINLLAASLNTSDGDLVNDKFNLKTLTDIRRQTIEFVRRQSPKLIEAFSEKLPDIVQDVLDAYPELGRFAPRIMDDLERTFLESAREMNATLQEEVADELTVAMRRSIVGGADMKKLQDDLMKSMETSRTRVVVLIERSVRDFQDETLRSAGKARAEATGENLYYLYLGPLDGKTRPFCEVRVDKALTQKAADSMKGTRERFNCRHSLVVVDEEYLEENPDVEIYRGLA